MYFLEHGLRAKRLAWLFALFGAITALVNGNMVQANSAALVLKAELNIPLVVSGIFLAFLTYGVIIGGIKRVGHVASFLVPVMCGTYLLGGMVLILIHITEVPAAFAMIFKSAFSGQAAMSRDPARQGTIAMLGVFVDTLLVNTITTLSIVLTGAWKTGLTSTALTAEGFSTVLGPLGGWIVAFGSISFAYSTLLTWSYYGLMCTDYLFGTRASLPYRLVWCTLIIVGALFSNDVAGIKFIWNLADVMNGAMAIPNLVGLLGLSLLVFNGTSAYYAPENMAKS
jgi:AGCS family alanine or glycine:cation symporter